MQPYLFASLAVACFILLVVMVVAMLLHPGLTQVDADFLKVFRVKFVFGPPAPPSKPRKLRKPQSR